MTLCRSSPVARLKRQKTSCAERVTKPTIRNADYGASMFVLMRATGHPAAPSPSHGRRPAWLPDRVLVPHRAACRRCCGFLAGCWGRPSFFALLRLVDLRAGDELVCLSNCLSSATNVVGFAAIPAGGGASTISNWRRSGQGSFGLVLLPPFPGRIGPSGPHPALLCFGLGFFVSIDSTKPEAMAQPNLIFRRFRRLSHRRARRDRRGFCQHIKRLAEVGDHLAVLPVSEGRGARTG